MVKEVDNYRVNSGYKFFGCFSSCFVLYRLDRIEETKIQYVQIW